MKKIILHLLCLFAFTACSDGIDYIKEFTNGEEIRYAGKVNDLKYFAGENRLALQYVLGSDPDVNKTVIFWNLKRDSVILYLDRTSMENDTVFYILEDMPENTYSFELYNYDNSGHVSVPTFLAGKSYGKKFRSSLYDREIDKSQGIDGFSLMQGGAVKLALSDSLATSIAVRIDYLDNNENEQTVYAENTDKYVILKDLKSESELKMTTYHIPEVNAIDSFALAPQTIIVPSIEEMIQTAIVDIPKPYAGAFIEGFDTPMTTDKWASLWDGRWGKTFDDNFTWADEAGWADCGTSAQPGVGPTWITIDMTKRGLLQKVWLQSYWPFTNSCPKVFEIWAFLGEDAPTAEDGWNNWVKVASFDTSNLTSKAELVEAYKKGYEVSINYKDAPMTQYIRIKNLKSYGYDENLPANQQTNKDAYNFSLSEISFSIYDVE